MKRAVTVLMTGLCLGLIAGCGTIDSTTNTQPTVDQTPFAVAKSLSDRITQAPSAQTIAAQASSINAFALDLYAELVGEQTGNMFFSPYSITAALGMTEAGARNQTATQIRQALSVTFAGDDFHAAINGLDLELTGHANNTDGLTLNIVNSTWAQTGWDFRVAYLDLLARYYGAGVNLLDFIQEPDPSRILINTWVADQANQKIKDLIPLGAITSDTRLVLTNAIYFLANWLYQFDPSLTSDQPFTRLDNSTVSVPLMQLGEAGDEVTLMYAQIGETRAVDLPYKGGRLCMTVIHPPRESFTAFESAMTTDTINAFVSRMDSTDLPPIRLPKFIYTSGSVSLVPALKALGMVDAFTGAADFSGIDGMRDLFVSDVFHKAFISVDETGTEAAAATAVIIGRTSIGPCFYANSPFIYVIRDRVTGAILFMGRVLDPGEES